MADRLAPIARSPETTQAYDRPVTSAAPPTVADEKALADLRGALQAADYTAERIEGTLGVGELSAAPADAAVHRRRLAGDDPFSTLARLFVLGDALDSARVSEAVSPLALDGLEALGLVEADGAGVRATVRLLPHGDYYVASDAAVDEPSSDWVAGIQAPSVTLAKLAVRNHVPTTLDLGTGCGIQALLAAKHSDRVVATDLNGRALAFATFNAALNEIGPVEFRRGSLLDPAADERFGLIVANPPYVISPDSTYMYRDGGYPGDELCRQIVQAIPSHLAEGGFAHVLVSWVHVPGDGDEWGEPLRGWVHGSGCDAWLLHYKTDDPLTHAAGWLGPLATSSAAEHEAALGRWLDYLRSAGIEAVGYGAVVLRRRSGAANWVRLDEIPIDRLEPATVHTLRIFEAEDYLTALPGESALLQERFELVDAHRLEQELVCRAGRFEVESQTLVLTEGLAFRAGLDRSTAMLLPHFERGRRLADVVAATAVDLEVEDADRERFALAALLVVRRLLELGFLVRSD
jgi:methylase of polypeptide subunit release factors